MQTLHVIVPAAGIGSRMQSDCPKQYLRLGQEFLLDQTLLRLQQALPECCLHVALHPQDRWWGLSRSATSAAVVTYTGGDNRAESVRLGLLALESEAGDDELVLVHDVARPCVTVTDIARVVSRAREHGAGALLAAPVADTVKHSDNGETCESTVDRQRLWRAFTPQVFRYGLLRAALERARQHAHGVTDEASAVEALGLTPALVSGRTDNLKVTVPEDLALAAFVLERQKTEMASHGNEERT